jgi:hypothetical protein
VASKLWKKVRKLLTLAHGPGAPRRRGAAILLPLLAVALVALALLLSVYAWQSRQRARDAQREAVLSGKVRANLVELRIYGHQREAVCTDPELLSFFNRGLHAGIADYSVGATYQATLMLDDGSSIEVELFASQIEGNPDIARLTARKPDPEVQTMYRLSPDDAPPEKYKALSRFLMQDGQSDHRSF